MSYKGAHGYVAAKAAADLGAHYPVVEITRCIDSSNPWFDDDPQVMVNVRIHGPALHPRRPHDQEEFSIDVIRMSDLDLLVKALTETIAVAREHNILPAPLSEEEFWRRAKVALSLEGPSAKRTEDDDLSGDEWKKQ